MIVLGVGMGFTTAPATEAIMGVVSKEKAGVGSAVNDATRELGGTLGVAVIGSIYASLYASGVDAAASVTSPVRGPRRERLHRCRPRRLTPTRLRPATHSSTPHAASFFDGFQVGCLVAAGVLFIGAAFVARFLPAHPTPPLEFDELAELEHNLALESLTTTPNHEHDLRDGPPKQ